MINKKDLQKINDYLWEIPKSFRSEMRVPARVYADEKMLDSIFRDKSLEQLVNTTTLPGIIKYAMVMPDCHEGYGFPIGGVAAMDLETGVISPGGVGYDINCLGGETEILHKFGYRVKIKDFEDIWPKEIIKSMNFSHGPINTEINAFQKFKPNNKVYYLKTLSGLEIEATEDHPFYTPGGMVPLGKLKTPIVAIYPFEGVNYESPDDLIIVSEKDIKKIPLSQKRKQLIIRELTKRDILPLRRNSKKLPLLLKLFGFILGDGTINFIGKKRKGVIWFYGESPDLEEIRKDIIELGYQPSKIYSRKRKHRINTLGGEKKFERTEYSFKTTSSSLVALFLAMGLPSGNKAAKDFSLPFWLRSAPCWQKRLFLAALFGAELSSPKTLSNANYNFYEPILSLNKQSFYLRSGEKFLKQIAKILSEMGIETRKKISKRKEYISKNKITSYRLRLEIVASSENLIKLYSQINYEYNKKRSYLANLALHYLKLKKQVLDERRDTIQRILKEKKQGKKNKEIFKKFQSKYINIRFIRRSLSESRKSGVRVAYNFPTFKEFIKKSTQGLGQSGMVWDKIIIKKEISKPKYVYDFTVNNPYHNFIANNFVVSNCGTRLLLADLTDKEIKPHLEKLATELNRTIPSGVGSTGKIKLDKVAMDRVLKEGARRVVEQGYGEKEDLERCESYGNIKEAEPNKVSEKAKMRGRDQLGTLGSGNHFLEIQKVTQIFDEGVAKKFGLYLNQITLLIHTGSRGLGHQVCTDYVNLMGRVLAKYKINLPDRELACAPFNSPEGQNYFGAMASAANFAWANRQVITYLTRRVWQKILNQSVKVLYDVAHNIAKIEEYDSKKLIVHRKGATRAFPPHHQELPKIYQSVGQPVLIPGSMGTASYILVGTQEAKESFYSVCHGAGRTMSRTAAKKTVWGEDLIREMAKRGIIVKCGSPAGLAEEAPEAYKNIDHVVKIVSGAGLAKRVARVVPLAVIKGE